MVKISFAVATSDSGVATFLSYLRGWQPLSRRSPPSEVGARHLSELATSDLTFFLFFEVATSESEVATLGSRMTEVGSREPQRRISRRLNFELNSANCNFGQLTLLLLSNDLFIHCSLFLFTTRFISVNWLKKVFSIVFQSVNLIGC